MKPKVSVLMAVYKTNPDYLKQSVESILNQTYTDFEFLIIDDFSNDAVLTEILESYAKRDQRIKLLQNEKNLGISATRNKLLDLAQGEYLAVMDHDDISLPQRLAKEVEFLDAHPDIGVVGTWYKKFPQVKVKKRYILNYQIERDLMFHCSILHPSAMLRKSVLDKYNIRYESTFSPAEDYALWCRLIGKTKFANLPEVLFKYRDYQYNTSKSQADKMHEATQRIYQFVHEDHPKLFYDACHEEKLSVLGIPVLTKKSKGCRITYKLFNVFNVKKVNRIDYADVSQLPIYIISFNRLSYLKQMIAFLEKNQLYNIHIIDNCSTYPPMLSYLEQTPYTVHKMEKNYGHMVFFQADDFKEVRENQYYVLTDPDVIPIDECPKDFLNVFYNLLQSYPKFNKVGFSLKTDDLPLHNEANQLVVQWEKQYYQKKLNLFKPFLYDSCIDTTFALYRPQKEWKTTDFYSAIRTGYPYEARHLPWYKDLSSLNDEDKYYNAQDCGSGSWNNQENLEKIKWQLHSKNIYTFSEKLFSYKMSAKRRILRIAGLKFTFNRPPPPTLIYSEFLRMAAVFLPLPQPSFFWI